MERDERLIARVVVSLAVILGGSLAGAAAQSGPPATFAGYLKGWPEPGSEVTAFVESPEGSSAAFRGIVESSPRGPIYRVGVGAASGNVTFRVGEWWGNEYAFVSPGLTMSMNLTPRAEGRPTPREAVVEVRVPANATNETVRVWHEGIVVAEAKPEPESGVFRAALPAWMGPVNVTLGEGGPPRAAALTPSEPARIDFGAPKVDDPRKGTPVGNLDAVGALLAAGALAGLAYRRRSS